MGDRSVLFDREPRDHLAEVPIIVDDLGDGQAPFEEIVAMLVGALPHLLVVEHLVDVGSAKGLAELIQENGKPLRELDFRRDGAISRRNPCPSAREDFFTVDGDKFA